MDRDWDFLKHWKINFSGRRFYSKGILPSKQTEQQEGMITHTIFSNDDPIEEDFN